MLFKRKISVEEYCKTRLDLLFSEEQAERWLQLKKSNLDPTIIAIDDDLFLTHMRAVHIELLSMVVVKKYAGSYKILMEMSMFIRKYLNEHKQLIVESLQDIYSQAIGSSPIDGILAMTCCMLENICQNQCAQKQF